MNLRRELWLKKQQIEDSEKMIEKMRAIKKSGEEFIEVSLSDSRFKADVSIEYIQIREYDSKNKFVGSDGLSIRYWKPFYEILHQIFGEKE